MFLKVGLKKGDVIAIGASGSFPSLILATLSAAKALDLKRLKIYFENAMEYKIKLFVNIGGASANFGECVEALKISPGLNKKLKICRKPNRGIIYEMAEKDIPIIHLLDIRSLAIKNGLPIDPVPFPEIGKGNIYFQTKYSRTVIIIVLGIIITLLLIFKQNKILKL